MRRASLVELRREPLPHLPNPQLRSTPASRERGSTVLYPPYPGAPERAGTNVAMRIVVLEKQSDPRRAPQARAPMDLSDITDIRALFDRLERLDCQAT